MHTPAIRLSVVIPARNAAATLPATLAALARQTVPAESYEVIVVDDGSKDDTAAVAAAAGAQVIRQEHQGPAVARNTGASVARGDILVFTDADCEPAEAFLAEIGRPFEDPAVSGAQGIYRTHQTGLVPRFAQLEFEDRYAYTARFSCLDLVATYAAAFRREVFVNAGGFDASYPEANNEDTELSYRLCRQGHRLVLAPRAMVYHRHPAGLIRYLRIKFWRAYWRLAACREHPGKVLRDGYTPAMIRIQTALAGLFVALYALSALWGGAGWLGRLCALGLLASSAPFAAFAWKRDKGVGAAAPFLVFARSLAFAGGAAWGVLDRRILPRVTGRPCA